MKSTTRAYWKEISKHCEALSKGKDSMYIDNSLEEEYIANCDKAYELCKAKEMRSDVVNLDRHKVAAILVIEASKLDLIKRKDGRIADTEDELFIGAQKILLISAISYLAQEINRIIGASGKNISKMKQFKMPEAFSCKTSYIDIMSRLLRNELDDNRLYILSWSEKFFLLEYIAISTYYGENAEQVYRILRKPVN